MVIQRLLLFYLLLFGSQAVHAIDLEGVRNPSLAFYLSSYSVGELLNNKIAWPEVKFRKMYMYDVVSASAYSDTMPAIDTVGNSKVSSVWIFDKDSNSLLRKGMVAASGTVKYYFNSKNRLIREIKTPDKYSEDQGVSDKKYSYDKQGNIFDPDLCKYDSLGRLIEYRQLAIYTRWDKLCYLTAKDSLPYLHISDGDSIFLYYDKGRLTKKVSISRTYFQESLIAYVTSEHFIYDKTGVLTEYIYYDNYYWDKSVHKKYLYNKSQQLIFIDSYFLNTDIKFSRWTFEYNDAGLLVVKKKENYPFDYGGKVEKYQFSYDYMNNLTCAIRESSIVWGAENGKFRFLHNISCMRYRYEY